MVVFSVVCFGLCVFVSGVYVVYICMFLCVYLWCVCK